MSHIFKNIFTVSGTGAKCRSLSSPDPGHPVIPPRCCLHCPAVGITGEERAHVPKPIVLMLMFGLLTLASGWAHADNALGQWRNKAGEIRLLAENDTQLAYTEAERLQAGLPADATPADQARLLNLLARIEMNRAQTDKAALHIRQAMEIARQHNDPVGQAEADLNAALNAVNQAKIDDAIAAADHALAVLDGVDRPDLLGEALLRMAMMYRRFNQFDESVTMALQAMDIARQSNNPLALAYAHHGLAITYEQSERYAEGLEQYERMLEQAKLTGSALMQAYALMGLGQCTRGLGNLKAAELKLREAIAIFHSVGSPFNLNFGLYGLADILRLQGHHAETLPLLDEAIVRYQRYSNKIGLWWTLNARSRSRMVLGDSDGARRDVEQAYALAEEIGVPVYLTDSAKQLAEIAAANGDHHQAYRFMREASEMAAKMAKDTAAMRVLQLTRRYQSESKQREIDKLNRRNREQAVELKQQALEQHWLWTVLGGSVIMLASTGFFMIRIKRSHRRLATLNTEVLQAKNKLQATLDAIPDLMFEVGLNGRYYDCHSPQSDLLAAPAEQLLGRTVDEVMSADAAAVCLAALREAHEKTISLGKKLLLSLPHGDFWFELSVAAKPLVAGEEPRFIVMSRNITERKRMEDALLISRQILTEAQRIAHIGSWELNLKTHALSCSDEIFRIFEIDQEQFSASYDFFLNAIHPGDRETVQRAYTESVENRDPYEIEYRLLMADGRVKHVLERCETHYGDDGKPLYSLSTVQDITEHKQAADALAAREREFRTLAESLPDNVVRYDREGRVIYVNPVLEKTLGANASKMLGTTVRERFPNGDYDDYAQLLDAVITSGAIGEIEKIVAPPYKDSHSVHSIRMVAERDDNGEVTGVLAIGRDITERKLVEDALRDSEEKYRTLVEKIQAAVIVHDADTKILISNPVAQEILGLTADQLHGKTAIDPDWHFHHEDGRQLAQEDYPVNQVLASGKALKNRVLGVHRPDLQENVWVLANADPVLGKDGAIIQVIVTFIDITERRQAEHHIALMSEALGKVHEAAYIMDDNARFLYVNDESCRALGYSRDELLAMSVMNIGPGWTIDMVRDIWEHQRKTKTVQAFEASHSRKDGSLFPVEINANQFEYDGKMYGLALVRDITERKQAENEIRSLNASLEQRVSERTEELRRQTRYLRTLIDTLPMMAWLKDKESRFLVVNQAIAMTCNMSVDDMVGKSDLDCWPHDYAEAYRSVDAEVMATGQRKTMEERFIDAHNDDIWVETFKAPVVDDDGSVLGTVGIARDISDRRVLEMARAAALAEAERLAQLRSQFMARMSHELRTPLNGIMGYAQILLVENRLNGRESGMLKVIQQSGEYLLQLINDILDFAKIEAGKQELSLGDIPLQLFLRNLANIITIKAEQKGLAFVCDVAADAPAGIRADETRLRQVLLNLLSNAVKYSERGRISLKITVLAAGRLRFEVRDTGIGIDSTQLETIFQAFEQAGDWQHRTGGTGLGLPISRELIRMMDSDIEVESRVGEGSVFGFNLDVPFVDAHEDISVAEQPVVGYQGVRRRVLVVDDINENRVLLIEILSRWGFETFEAANGRVCLDNVERQMPDIILLDMVMPVMDGLETARRLRGLPDFGQTPIIAVSASASRHDVAEAMKAGVSVFLPKPIDITRLAAHFADLLKLDWIYASPDTGTVPQLNGSLVEPPLGEMTILHRLAQEGSMRDIIEHAAHLEGLDPCYRPFAAQLRVLAQGYQSKAILALVEGYINKIGTTDD
ncbi:MAG: PAS domain S-box protein [Methylobacter sp.]